MKNCIKMTEFERQYNIYLHMVEAGLEKFLPLQRQEWPTSGIPANLAAAMRYSLLSGGKRLRPVMLLASYNMLSNQLEDALPFAAAMEMIHTYSLIHDDLPAMDNDDMRRGKPSNHKMFGEATAILAGDALLNHAYETMAQSNHPLAMKALMHIAFHAGASGMIAGQAADLAMEEEQPDMDMVYYIQRHKTSDLFMGAVKAGLALAGADSAWINAAESYALHYGLAFQITDDILDIIADENVLGKSIGKDQSSGKMTWPGTVGLEKAKLDAQTHIEKAIQAAEIFGSSGAFFVSLAKQIQNRVK